MTSQALQPRRRALLVATSRYDDPRFAKLRGAAADVDAVEAVLADPMIGEFEIAGSLVDRTKQDVEEAIVDFLRRSLPQDLLLLYLSGHGVLSENRRDWFFATTNSKRDNLDATAVWDAWLRDRMSNSRANSIVLILDCCHSGAFIDGRSPKGEREVHVEHLFEDAGTGRVTLTASTSLEYAFEIGEARTTDLGAVSAGSVFTKHLVEGLRSREADMDMDGRVTVDELFHYIERKLQSETPKQTPGRGGQIFGNIFVAHGRQTHLPPEIWSGLNSRNAAMREGMVAVLTSIRTTVVHQHPDERAAALEEIDAALRRLASDDHVPAVRYAAAAALNRVADEAGDRVGTPPRPRVMGRYRGGLGSPDGARSNLIDMMAGFVQAEDARLLTGVGMNATDWSVRVIVGRRGSGRTLYLRRLQAAASAEAGVYAAPIETPLLRTEDVVRITDWCEQGHGPVERWEEIWRRAIVGSVASHLLMNTRMASYGSSADRDWLAADYASVLAPARRPRSIGEEVATVVAAATSKPAMDQYLARPEWADVENSIGELLRSSPPLCFYLDGLDERYQDAPRHWQLCQLGLLRLVVRLAREGSFASRLHVVISVRDSVFAATQDGEGAMRYLDTSIIRVLDWDNHLLRHFLERKIEALDPGDLIDPEAEDLLHRWLGETTIRHDRNDVTERLDDYLLRHTRLVPRDVVVLGNLLCETVRTAHDEGHGFVGHSAIRDAVHHAARRFGEEELHAVSNNLTALLMPPGAAEHGYASFYLDGYGGHNSYQAALRRRIITAIQSELRADRFDREALERFEQRMDVDIQLDNSSVADVLWQHGLLGYIEGDLWTGRVTFYSSVRADGPRLPRDELGYAIHPVITHAIASMRHVGDVVSPF